MKTFALTALVSFLAAGASAAPSGQSDDITFQGAADASAIVNVPCNSQTVPINVGFSVSHILQSNDHCSCTFRGIDNGSFDLGSSREIDVGPPQVIVSAVCVFSGRGR